MCEQSWCGKGGKKKIFTFAFAFLSAPGDPGSGKVCIFKACGELMQVDYFRKLSIKSVY